MKNNNDTTFWIIIAIAALFFLFSGFGMMGYYYGMPMMYGYGSMFGFGWIFMLLVSIAIILLIIWLVKQLQGPKKVRRRK